MKKFLVAMGVAAFAFVGCDDSTSASSETNDDNVVIESSSSSSEKAKSSSSKEEKKAKESSSSVKPESTDKLSSSSKKMESSSSSSVIASSAKQSSSSGKAPASSEPAEGTSSSSSKKAKSSSSSSDETSVSSSSSADALSSFSKGLDWSLPKEAYLNPDIDYGTMTDERDGKVYKTVKIGNQTWMAENLNYYDSTNISVKEKSWCYGKYDNGDSSTCDVAGRLYTWAAAIDSVKLANDADNPQDCGFRKACNLPAKVQGVCPPDWHLPSRAEWKALLTAVGGQSSAGKVLKSQSGWYKNGNGTDAFGFSALPAGDKYYKGDFSNEGRLAEFWSSTEYINSDEAYHMDLSYEDGYANLSGYAKYYGESVRCVKD